MGYRVTYLQDLVNPGHLLLQRGYYDTWKRGCRREDNVWIATGCSVIPKVNGLGVLARWSAQLSYRLTIPTVRKAVESGRHGPPDLIWTTVSGSSTLRRSFPNARLLFHVVDYYPAFKGEWIRSLERRDYELADHVFSIGESLSAYLRSDLGVPACKLTTLGQGAPLEGYVTRLPQPRELTALPRPRAVYLGVLGKLDANLLRATAEAVARLGGSVVLIGPSAAWLQGILNAHPNVRFLGPVAATDSPAYLQHCDVGLMLYDLGKSQVYRGQNPLKLYEYGAAGLPVLSTPHDEYAFLKPPVRVVARPAEVASALAEIVTTQRVLGQAMRDFAQQHSWEACVERAQQVLQSLLSRGTENERARGSAAQLVG
jgi:glycosyltransferase involved in cell wall biosynthesis